MIQSQDSQELISILREQLAQRDARIATLESLLQAANEKAVKVSRPATNTDSQSPVRSTLVTQPGIDDSPRPIKCTTSSKSDKVEKRSSGSVTVSPIALPDLGPQIQIIAEAVVAAADARNQQSIDTDEKAQTDRGYKGRFRQPAVDSSGVRGNRWRFIWPFSRRGVSDP